MPHSITRLAVSTMNRYNIWILLNHAVRREQSTNEVSSERRIASPVSKIISGAIWWCGSLGKPLIICKHLVRGRQASRGIHISLKVTCVTRAWSHPSVTRTATITKKAHSIKQSVQQDTYSPDKTHGDCRYYWRHTDQHGTETAQYNQEGGSREIRQGAYKRSTPAIIQVVRSEEAGRERNPQREGDEYAKQQDSVSHAHLYTPLIRNPHTAALDGCGTTETHGQGSSPHAKCERNPSLS
jgi:hypothetical protein